MPRYFIKDKNGNVIQKIIAEHRVKAPDGYIAEKVSDEESFNQQVVYRSSLSQEQLEELIKKELRQIAIRSLKRKGIL